MEKEKTTIICGVYHEMTEEERSNFINMMSDNGKYDVVFDDGNSTPKLVEMSLPFSKPSPPKPPKDREVHVSGKSRHKRD